jgi:hypothetical protein
MINNPDKIQDYIKGSYPMLQKYNEDLKMDVYEKHMNDALEHFRLFMTDFTFNADEMKVLDAFMFDDEIQPNIKFIGWEDYWITS